MATIPYIDPRWIASAGYAVPKHSWWDINPFARLAPLGGEGDPVIQALGKGLDKTWDWIGENKATLAVVGGSLLSGLVGDWMEDRAQKGNKEWQERQSAFAVAPESVGRGLEDALQMARSRPISSAEVAASAKRAGGASLQAAKAKFQQANEAAMAQEGLARIQSMANQAQALSREMSRRREVMVASNIAAKGRLQTRVGAESAEFLGDTAESAYSMSHHEGDLWRQAIGGLTKMGSLFLSGGTSDLIKTLSAELAKEVI